MSIQKPAFPHTPSPAANVPASANAPEHVHVVTPTDWPACGSYLVTSTGFRLSCRSLQGQLFAITQDFLRMTSPQVFPAPDICPVQSLYYSGSYALYLLLSETRSFVEK